MLVHKKNKTNTLIFCIQDHYKNYKFVFRYLNIILNIILSIECMKFHQTKSNICWFFAILVLYLKML